jgi:hypothetical protein
MRPVQFLKDRLRSAGNLTSLSMTAVCRSSYLWLLHLDGAGLAWEYLRRNAVYIETWRRRPKTSKANAAQARLWGLKVLEDPSDDARVAQPHWTHDPQMIVQLVSARRGSRFDLWAMYGRKTLVQDEDGVVGVAAPDSAAGVRFRVSTPVLDGRPFAFAVPAGPGLGDRFADAERFQKRYAGAEPRIPQPRKSAFDQMHRLLALDALAAGLRGRQLAALIFGPIAEREWETDGRHRSNLRYLLRRAEEFRDGGYRALAGLPPAGEAA